jgi:hypothetical protein
MYFVIALAFIVLKKYFILKKELKNYPILYCVVREILITNLLLSSVVEHCTCNAKVLGSIPQRELREP